MFSISDARNDEGEWIMSPEQIRSEQAADLYDDFDAGYSWADDEFGGIEPEQADPATCQHGDWSSTIKSNGLIEIECDLCWTIAPLVFFIDEDYYPSW